tara:strand:+ start:680 stop:862 length:183 start_codon:yes stop_codon:yes gene_type:complete
MAENLEVENIYDLHLEAFGVEPVVTGINYAESGSLVERLIEAIQVGVPYVEQPVPEGVST